MVPSPQSDRARLRPDGHVPEVRRIAVAESSFLLLAVSPVRSRGQLHLERIPAVQISLVIEEGFVSSSVIDSANIYPYCTYPVLLTSNIVKFLTKLSSGSGVKLLQGYMLRAS